MRRGQSYPGRPPARYGAFETAHGPVSYATDGEHVRVIRLGQEIRDETRPTALDRETLRQLKEYFRGERPVFDLPLHLDMSPFTTAVLRAVERIPFGEAMSYGDVAHTLNRPRAARAVGNAVGSNPLPLVIPCHRVLASEGRLGGFGCGLGWKRFLLALEGIRWR
jgi:methylated-DNA-[protein]-cysteine S-methyltransferase